MHRGTGPTDELAVVEDGQHDALVGVVDVPVAGVVVHEHVTRADTDGRVVRPVLENELDRVLDEGRKEQYTAAAGDCEVTARAVQPRDEVPPLRPGGGTHLFQGLEGLVETGLQLVADETDEGVVL